MNSIFLFARTTCAVCFAAGLLTASPAASGAMPVIDVRAISQLAQQITTLRSQLRTAQDQLGQARQLVASSTGPRGMERLLAGTSRDYLPPDWMALEAAAVAGGRYAAIGARIRDAASRIAALSATAVGALGASERDAVLASRQRAAALQVATGEALDRTSDRFASLQALIDALATASDQKAVLDLQARIAAEQAMLQNEQTKLDLLGQAAAAAELAATDRRTEIAATEHGSFAARFRPVAR
jgi:type IV secretion system protein VirB5